MTFRLCLFASTSLALFAVPATAQLASPLGGSAQSSSSGNSNGNRMPGVSVPEASPAPFSPARLESSEPDAAPAPLPPRASAEAPEHTPVPAPPSEFERHVSKLAGKPLRRFGAELLPPEARDFTTPAVTAIPADYLISPGDQLRLDLTGSVQGSNLKLTVDNEGRIFVPRVGAVTVGGVRYGDARNVLMQQVGRQYRGFELEVGIARLRGLTVYVTGFARRPGAYTVNSLSTLVNAVLAAGGPTEGGSFRSIQLRRGGRLVSDFDLYDLLLRGDTSGDATLRNGDVIHIAPAGAQVAITGSVNREAIFELSAGETLADAIADAGGANTVADTTRLMVLDALGTTGGWQQLTAADARTTQVTRAQIVRVLSDLGIARPVAQQPVLITLGGEVAKPGRYYVQPGTRLGDVIQQAGGLTAQAFPYASIITRQSVKEQQRESFARAVDDMELLLSTQPLVSAQRAQLTSAGNLKLMDQVVGKMRQREPNGRLVFDLPVTAKTLPTDLIVENDDMVLIPTRPVSVGVFGAVPSPASFAYREGQTIGDVVELAGGVQSLADKKEVFVVRANGTVLARGKATYKLPALPGDLVFVPVDADRGEFWARLRDITGSLFGGIVGAASINSIVN